MTNTQVPYPAYRPSGIPWLVDIPGHWDVRRIKTLFREKDERNPDGSGELLSLTRLHGLIPQRKASNRIASIEDLSNYKICRPGDLVMNRMQAWSGMFAVPSQEGVISPDYCVFELVCESEVEYFERLFKTSYLVGQFAQKSRGIGSGFNRLYTEDFGSIPVPVPPLREQAAIVRYLDQMDERIRRYVRAKERLIRLLEEEKQAVIHRAVTCGLDPNIHFKPSGVDGLGYAPAHWEIGPLKRAFQSMDYGVSESASDSGDIRLLTMAHLNDGQVSVPAHGGVDFVNRHLLLRKNDLLFNRTNSPELVGKVGLFTGHGSPVTFASYLVRMRPYPNHEPAYLNLVLNEFSFISRARREAIPSLHQSNLNPTRYGRLHVALPPKQEQQTILRALKKKTTNLRHAIRRTRRQIKLLQEYQTQLIADVVTGKLDVRGVSARLQEIGSLDTESGTSC